MGMYNIQMKGSCISSLTSLHPAGCENMAVVTILDLDAETAHWGWHSHKLRGTWDLWILEPPGQPSMTEGKVPSTLCNLLLS